MMRAGIVAKGAVVVRVRSWTSVVLAMAMAMAMVGVTPMTAAETTLPDLIERIKPSIVGVGTFERTRRPPGNLLGTGFVVLDGRHVMTNLHVLPQNLDARNKESLAVFVGTGNDPELRLATRVLDDPDHDLAVLKISDTPLPALTLGDSDRVREGELYAFTGFPIGSVLGLYPATHRGTVSAITPLIVPLISTKKMSPKMVERLRNPYLVFQLDATAYPGNSGSPLYDPNSGEVMGIINKVFVQGSKENALEKPSGISYAIPAKYARKLLDEVERR